MFTLFSFLTLCMRRRGRVIVWSFRVWSTAATKNLSGTRSCTKDQGLTQGSTRMRIFRERMTLSQAKTWILCRPSKALRTLIKPERFTTWMKCYCRVPLFQSGTKCPSVRCDTIMDVYGDHLLHCESGIHRITRYDAKILRSDQGREEPSCRAPPIWTSQGTSW